MKRRAQTVSEQPPVRLARFALEDWPTRDVCAAFGAWTEARRAWVSEGHAWPGGVPAMEQQELDAVTRLPDQEWSL